MIVKHDKVNERISGLIRWNRKSGWSTSKGHSFVLGNFDLTHLPYHLHFNGLNQNLWPNRRRPRAPERHSENISELTEGDGELSLCDRHDILVPSRF